MAAVNDAGAPAVARSAARPVAPSSAALRRVHADMARHLLELDKALGLESDPRVVELAHEHGLLRSTGGAQLAGVTQGALSQRRPPASVSSPPGERAGVEDLGLDRHLARYHEELALVGSDGITFEP
jgi:hypothetical protein